MDLNKIQRKMESEGINFFELIFKIKELYPKYKLTPTKLYDNEYIDLNNNIDKKFEILYEIKNDVIKASEDLEELTKNQDNYLDNIKGTIDNKVTELDALKSNELASKPRMNDKHAEYNLLIATNVIQGTIFIGYIFFLYKLFKN